MRPMRHFPRLSRSAPLRGVLAGFAAGAGVALAFALALSASQTQAHGEGEREGERPLFKDWPELLVDPESFDGERLSKEAERAVEELLAIIGPFMERLSIAIGDLPRYEAPVILPNGDILIRRIPDGAVEDEEAPLEEDDLEERRLPDGTYKL